MDNSVHDEEDNGNIKDNSDIIDEILDNSVSSSIPKTSANDNGKNFGKKTFDAIVIVPHVVGMSNADAYTALSLVNLQTGFLYSNANKKNITGRITPTYRTSSQLLEGEETVIVVKKRDKIPEGIVSHQTPSGGSTISSDSLVTLQSNFRKNPKFYPIMIISILAFLVLIGTSLLILIINSDNPNPNVSNYTVAPSLIGMTAQDARNTMAERGFSVCNVAFKDVQDSANIVLSQNPLPNTVIDKNGIIDLVVSSPPTIEVPNVIGSLDIDAKNFLVQNDLKLGTVVKQYNDKLAGTVLYQTPSGGTIVKPNTPINIVISSGQRVIPNVVGLPLPAASAALIKQGFLVQVDHIATSQVSPNVVVAQSLLGGTTSIKGTKIILTVAKKLNFTPTSAPTNSSPPQVVPTPKPTKNTIPAPTPIYTAPPVQIP